MRVAVVGAGIGGLFAAWRLLKSGKGLDVTVYEGSDRVGGRLLTWHPEGPKNPTRGELGGMRFIPDQHKMVARLVQELHLKPVKFPATTQFTYLRGVRLKDYTNVPYNLRADERGKSPTDLLKSVIKLIANKNGIPNPLALTRQQWDEKKPHMMWKGQPLSSIGFWNVMLDIVSGEGYNYITDGLGYYSLTSNWNAAEALQFISTDFASDEYDTLLEGYSALAVQIAADPVMKGRVKPQSKVTSIERAGRQWRLTFENGKTDTPDCVVMGLPGRSIELIDFPTDVRQRLARLQPAVIRVPAFKLFLLYKEGNWWKDGQGRFTTTLPVRQTYNFNVVPNPEQFMAMASYDDQTAVPFWHGLESAGAPPNLAAEHLAMIHPHRFSGSMPGHEATEMPKGFHVAPPGMIARAQTQMAEAVGTAIPAPDLSAYMDWSEDPYGGGWSFWAPGVNVPTAMQDMRHLADNLFVVGDSFSGIQGWVEGALTYTEKLLQDEFKLTPYLPGYYLGH